MKTLNRVMKKVKRVEARIIVVKIEQKEQKIAPKMLLRNAFQIQISDILFRVM